MAYNSFIYLGFFLAVVYLVWAAVPGKAKPFVLLGGSLLFYWVASGIYILWMLAAALITWLTGLLLARLDGLFAAAKDALAVPERKAMRKQVQATKKAVVGIGAAMVLGIFIWMKYTAFFANACNAVLIRLPVVVQLPVPAYLLPLGLSFYSLMAVSYVVDVYRGTVQAAPRLWQVVSYLCFWPHIVEGPFDRYGALAPSLFSTENKPSFHALTFGAQRILWGMFKKVVIADRANMYVAEVFGCYDQYSGLAVVCGALMYTLQIYAEFSGCMDIVLGSAMLFGIPLAENFRQPFFSKSVSEFWRRWHITLGAWLKEYLFQPFIMSAPVMRFGKFCRQKFGPAAGRNWPVRLGLFVTWAAIGLWHGASSLYLAYGLYYFALVFLGEVAEPLLLRLLPGLPGWRKTKWYGAWQILRTFVLVNIGMLIFRAESLQVALYMLRQIFTPYTGTLVVGVDVRDIAVIVAGAIIMLVVDLLQIHGVALRNALAAKPLPLRWAVCMACILSIMIFGAYGDNYDPAAFIYAQF